jgi:hypothetical protein
MKVHLSLLVYWGIIPFINFIFWFYLSKTQFLSNTQCATLSDQPVHAQVEQSLEAMLEQSRLELEAETQARPCELVDVDSSTNTATECNHRVPIDHNEYFVTLEETYAFETYRTEQLASMAMDLVLKTYTDDDTLVLHYRGNKVSNDNDECQSIDHHMLPSFEQVCMAVVYSDSTDVTLDIARIDQDIDIYGLSISNPDPSQIDKYSTRYALNAHNNNKFWPTGFFRKVPKERGRERTKEKLGML